MKKIPDLTAENLLIVEEKNPMFSAIILLTAENALKNVINKR